MYYTPHYFRVDSVLVTDIAKAINGEYSAIACYEQLAKLAPTAEERNRILEIREDELKHYRLFTHLYTALTGTQPTPQLVEQCPTEYRAGLEFAFKDEQKTVDFYLEISDKA